MGLKPKQGFNYTGIQEQDALIACALEIRDTTAAVLLLLTLAAGAFFAHRCWKSGSMRYFYVLSSLATAMELATNGLALYMVYFGVPAYFAPVLPATCAASFEGPDGWPCYTKALIESVSKFRPGHGGYDGAMLRSLWISTRYHGLRYLIHLLFPVLGVRLGAWAGNWSVRREVEKQMRKETMPMA